MDILDQEQMEKLCAKNCFLYQLTEVKTLVVSYEIYIHINKIKV